MHLSKEIPEDLGFDFSMMLFTNLFPSLRYTGCDNEWVVSISQYRKYLVSHMELWTVSIDCTGIFSIGEKNNETQEKVHTY